MTTKLKIGEHLIFKYDNPPVPKEKQYKIGSFVKIFDDVTHKLIGQYKVVQTNQFKILGLITNTYGHKRRKVTQ